MKSRIGFGGVPLGFATDGPRGSAGASLFCYKSEQLLSVFQKEGGMKRFSKILVFLSFAVFLVAPCANGLPILHGTFDTDAGLWQASDADRSATAEFKPATLSGTAYLRITLTNIADETKVPNQMLAGLFFDFSGTLGAALSVYLTTKEDKVISEKETYLFGVNLSGEFGYLTGISAVNGGLGDYGISATSLDQDPPDVWPGFGVESIIDPLISIIPEPPPAGADFALVGGTFTGNNPPDYYVQSSVVIVWDVPESGTVSNVHFIYGTDFYPVPEPGTMLLLGAGLIGLATVGRKKLFKR